MKKAAKIPPGEEEEEEGETEHSGSPPVLMGREINFEPLALPPPAQRSSPRGRSLAPLVTTQDISGGGGSGEIGSTRNSPL